LADTIAQHSQAEVAEDRLPVVSEQDIAGLDVSVDNTLAMCVVQSAGDLR
jgi:hypothetical protein